MEPDGTQGKILQSHLPGKNEFMPFGVRRRIPGGDQPQRSEEKETMTVSAILHQIPVPDFDAIRAMTSEDAANPVVDILRTVEAADERIESMTRQVYAIRGAAMKIAEEKKIWEQWVDPEVCQRFRSLDRWNKATFPKSWRYNQEALATISKLPDVPMEQLISMPRCNMVMLANNVSSSVRALPDVLQAAQTLSEDEFAAKLSTEHGQHLERKETLKFTYSKGEAEMVKLALGMVGKLIDVEDMSGQLLALAIDYIAEHRA
jgi:hypothetical protein